MSTAISKAAMRIINLMLMLPYKLQSIKLNKIKNLKIEALPVKSTYWGNTITVADLITSDDLINAVKNINLVLPAGKTIAFVGANGSGKTTLIKLLCGFYKPQQGCITFDGKDINELGQKKILENISAVFQDFVLYNIPAIDNLALGDVKKIPDKEKIRKAAQAAGIDDVLDRLPHGYDTLLGNLFKGGEELSIGQWQKMAVARAFYRDAPLLLMDEPSSALDAASELQMIKSLQQLSSNKTAVIVSHRLTTIQWADLIYMFHEGEIIESGNHKELMALKGKYFDLFQTVNSRM